MVKRESADGSRLRRKGQESRSVRSTHKELSPLDANDYAHACIISMCKLKGIHVDYNPFQ